MPRLWYLLRHQPENQVGSLTCFRMTTPWFSILKAFDHPVVVKFGWRVLMKLLLSVLISALAVLFPLEHCLEVLPRPRPGVHTLLSNFTSPKRSWYLGSMILWSVQQDEQWSYFSVIQRLGTSSTDFGTRKGRMGAPPWSFGTFRHLLRLLPILHPQQDVFDNFLLALKSAS